MISSFNDNEMENNVWQVTNGIRIFICSGTSDIIKAPFIGVELQDVTVQIKKDHRKRNNSSSSSSSSDGSDNGTGGSTCVTDSVPLQV